MEILDSFTADDHNTIFAVALEPGFVVDVKVCPKTGFVYVMQNEDGSTVYGQAFSDYTFPDFEYDEEAVIQFVKKNSGLFDEKEKAVPSSLLDQATLKKAYDEILKECHYFGIATEYKDLPSWVAAEGAKGVAEEIMTGWATEGTIKGNSIHQLLNGNSYLEDEDLFDLMVETVIQHAEQLKKKPSLDQKIQSVAKFVVSSAEKSSGRKSPEHSVERN